MYSNAKSTIHNLSIFILLHLHKKNADPSNFTIVVDTSCFAKLEVVLRSSLSEGLQGRIMFQPSHRLLVDIVFNHTDRHKIGKQV